MLCHRSMASKHSVRCFGGARNRLVRILVLCGQCCQETCFDHPRIRALFLAQKIKSEGVLFGWALGMKSTHCATQKLGCAGNASASFTWALTVDENEATETFSTFSVR